MGCKCERIYLKIPKLSGVGITLTQQRLIARKSAFACPKPGKRLEDDSG